MSNVDNPLEFERSSRIELTEKTITFERLFKLNTSNDIF